LGQVRTMVAAAWADIQSRFGALCDTAGVQKPHYVFGESDWFSRMKYPAMFLTLDNVRQETSSQLADELSVTLDLVIVHTSGKPETLETQMMDYTDCMLELMRDDHTLGGACQIGEFVSSELYGGSQDSRDVGVAVVTVLLRKEVLI